MRKKIATTGTPKGYTPKDYKQNHELIVALTEEVDRQRTFAVQKRSNLMTRASILTTAAAIVTGLSVSKDANWLYSVSVASAALAAITGVIALFSRKSPEVNVQGLQDSYWGESADEALQDIKDHKSLVLKKDEASLTLLGQITNIGFLLLAVAVLSAAIAVIQSNGGA